MSHRRLDGGRDVTEPETYAKHTPRETGIPFTSPLVRQIRARRKLRTSRPIAFENSTVDGPTNNRKLWASLDFLQAWIDEGPNPAGNPGPYLHVPDADGVVHRVYPRVQPGDVLWVRETWHEYSYPQPGIEYAADTDLALSANKRIWSPSIHMPRWAARLLLPVTRVTCERSREIAFYDIRAEGLDCPEHDGPGFFCCSECASLRKAWTDLWSSLYPTAPPWCWAYRWEEVREA